MPISSMPEFMIEDNRLRELLHRFAAFSAFLLQHEVRTLFADLEVLLEYPLGPFNDLTFAQFLGNLGPLRFESRHLDFSAHHKADHREQPDFPLVIFIRRTVLQVDYADQLASAQNG